jgi:hypothetical protein
MEMRHDTMSGAVTYYDEKTGKIEAKLYFEPGIYDVPFTDTDFVFKINHKSFVKMTSYNDGIIKFLQLRHRVKK